MADDTRLRAADVLNRAGVGADSQPRPFVDADLWVTCPCGLDQSLWTATIGPASDHVANITEYRCSADGQVLAVTGYHGLHEKPLRWGRYRMKDYVIECRVDVRVQVAGGNWLVLSSAPPP